jgi:hypothetical protein
MREQQHDVNAEVISQDVTMDCVDAAGTVTSLEASFGYDPADPYAVTATFRTAAGSVVWTFARELLSRGLTSPTGVGDVHIWPCLDSVGRAVVIIELSSPDGELVAQAPTQEVYRFVSRSLALVPAGLESAYVDMDELIGQILGEAA